MKIIAVRLNALGWAFYYGEAFDLRDTFICPLNLFLFHTESDQTHHHDTTQHQHHVFTRLSETNKKKQYNDPGVVGFS